MCEGPSQNLLPRFPSCRTKGTNGKHVGEGCGVTGQAILDIFIPVYPKTLLATSLPAGENAELTPCVDAILLDAKPFAGFRSGNIGGLAETGIRVGIEGRQNPMKMTKGQHVTSGPTALVRRLVALDIQLISDRLVRLGMGEILDTKIELGGGLEPLGHG